MSMSNGAAVPNHHDLMAIYHNTLRENIERGFNRPILLPYDLLGFAILIGYLCIPHVNRPWLYAARWPVALVIVAFYVDMIRSTRSSFMGSGFGVGLMASWGMVWSVTWLVFNEAQKMAERVERRTVEGNGVLSQVGGGGEPTVTGSASGSERLTNAETNESIMHSRKEYVRPVTTNGHVVKDKEAAKQFDYFWQSYPLDSLWTRLNWINDLVYTFRGPGWNWGLRQNPDLPLAITKSLGISKSAISSRCHHSSHVTIRYFTTRTDLARHLAPKFLFTYLLLDFLKVVLMKDAYFVLGAAGISYPHPYPLPDYLVQFTRELLAISGIITALEAIFALSPLIFCVLLGPRILGLRGEPFMYPTTWGSLSTIGTQGLNGLWSGWWHQTFRYAFISPTQYLIRQKILSSKATSTKIIGVLIAFSISGLLHASGSYTQIASTKPWECVIFFELQALGIFTQIGVCKLLHTQIKGLPKGFRQAGNFVFAFSWLYMTGPYLIEDFARGGIWLFQPVPFSPLRALGFGVEGDSWWCWDFSGIGWYEGRKWWMKGLAF